MELLFQDVKKSNSEQGPLVENTEEYMHNQDETEETMLDVRYHEEYETNLNLLAHLIFAEAGSDNISDEQQILVGIVAMNRVKSKKYPNTLYEVIYQSGQYACTWDGNFEKEPNERAYSNAKIVLDNQADVHPVNVIYSAEFEQGSGVYKKLGNTYFCYE